MPPNMASPTAKSLFQFHHILGDSHAILSNYDLLFRPFLSATKERAMFQLVWSHLRSPLVNAIRRIVEKSNPTQAPTMSVYLNVNYTSSPLPSHSLVFIASHLSSLPLLPFYFPSAPYSAFIFHFSSVLLTSLPLPLVFPLHLVYSVHLSLALLSLQFIFNFISSSMPSP